jgi:tRNA-specific 2-thiouridylase
MVKPDVRRLARESQLPNWQKKDSQGICFLGKVKIQDFLSHHMEDCPGEIVDTDGKILGQHRGLFRFTFGQRHGINLPSNRDFAHYVVVGKDMSTNRLIVEIETPASKNLFSREFFIHTLSMTNKPFQDYKDLLARPRYRDPVQEIESLEVDGQSARVVFKHPQRAIAPGQVIAFYHGKKLVGGGIFATSSPGNSIGPG